MEESGLVIKIISLLTVMATTNKEVIYEGLEAKIMMLDHPGSGVRLFVQVQLLAPSLTL
jgi:hypothetical protein